MGNNKRAPHPALTYDEALTLFAQDLVSRERTVRDAVAVAVPLTQGQFDALVSFVYNVGGARFRGCSISGPVGGRSRVDPLAEAEPGAVRQPPSSPQSSEWGLAAGTLVGS